MSTTFDSPPLGRYRSSDPIKETAELTESRNVAAFTITDPGQQFQVAYSDERTERNTDVSWIIHFTAALCYGH